MGLVVKVDAADCNRVQVAQSLVESLERIYKNSLDLPKEQRADIYVHMSDANLAFENAKKELIEKYQPKDNKNYSWNLDYNTCEMTFELVR